MKVSLYFHFYIFFFVFVSQNKKINNFLLCSALVKIKSAILSSLCLKNLWTCYSNLHTCTIGAACHYYNCTFFCYEKKNKWLKITQVIISRDTKSVWCIYLYRWLRCILHFSESRGRGGDLVDGLVFWWCSFVFLFCSSDLFLLRVPFNKVNIQAHIQTWLVQINKQKNNKLNLWLFNSFFL